MWNKVLTQLIILLNHFSQSSLTMHDLGFIGQRGVLVSIMVELTTKNQVCFNFPISGINSQHEPSALNQEWLYFLYYQPQTQLQREDERGVLHCRWDCVEFLRSHQCWTGCATWSPPSTDAGWPCLFRKTHKDRYISLIKIDIQHKVYSLITNCWLHQIHPCLPRVMPLGQTTPSVTSTVRSAPFNPLLSILAFSPQSDQYMKLGNGNNELKTANQITWFIQRPTSLHLYSLF